MAAHSEKLQRIVRLTPLGDVLPLIDILARPVAPQHIKIHSAAGLILADDVKAPADQPRAPIAIRDGWAVSSADILDAGAAAPVPLAQEPAWLEVGDPLPSGANALAP